MTESTSKKGSRSIARIYRAGQAREIQPAPDRLRLTLRTSAHVVASRPDQTVHVIAADIPLFHEVEIAGKPGLAYWAGWEPVVRRLLLTEGYAVETLGTSRPPLPAPELEQLQQLSVVDHALLECLRQQERALIRYDVEEVDPVYLIAQVARAWPKQRIAVIVTRISEGRHFCVRLRSYGIRAVAVNSRNQPSQVGTVIVCTPAGLSHLPVMAEWLDIVLILNAREITSKIGMECIGHAERARLFGLLEAGERPAPLEHDFMTALFGFHQIMIPCHGYRERLVQVLRYPIQGGPRLPRCLDVLTAKRLGIWHHALRNRKVAQIALAFRENNIDKIQHLFVRDASRLPSCSRSGVVVLVENIEHALALGHRLPNWPILTGFEVCLDGLPAEQAEKVESVSSLGEDKPLYAIVTAAGIGLLNLSSVGVLLRAVSGVGLPSLPRHMLVEPATSAPCPLLLIDLNDRHHPLLRRWSRWRQNAYGERGWFAPGVDPIQARVERFLSTRATGRSR